MAHQKSTFTCSCGKSFESKLGVQGHINRNFATVPRHTIVGHPDIRGPIPPASRNAPLPQVPRATKDQLLDVLNALDLRIASTQTSLDTYRQLERDLSGLQAERQIVMDAVKCLDALGIGVNTRQEVRKASFNEAHPDFKVPQDFTL